MLSPGGEARLREENPSLEWVALSTGDSPNRRKYNKSMLLLPASLHSLLWVHRLCCFFHSLLTLECSLFDLPVWTKDQQLSSPRLSVPD